ncbi:MAG: hypothetical protein Q8P67_04095 [archaeon]|nr:hypothetical protein [archaeon]
MLRRKRSTSPSSPAAAPVHPLPAAPHCGASVPPFRCTLLRQRHTPDLDRQCAV